MKEKETDKMLLKELFKMKSPWEFSKNAAKRLKRMKLRKQAKVSLLTSLKSDFRYFT